VLDRHRTERRLSLGALWVRAHAMQAAIVRRGLEPGGFALLALPTGPELLASYLGVLLAGGVPGMVATPSNRVADRSVYARRIGMILRDAGAAVLVCDPEVGALFRGEGAALLGRTVALEPGDVGAAHDGVAVVAARPDDIATVQYSSGSTGTPKGILLTHRAMLNNIRAVRDGLGLGPDDVSVNWIPLYHDMGLIDAFLLPVLAGCPTVLIPTMDFMREPSLWLWAVHRYRGALSWAPNFAYTLCARRVAEADVEGLDLSSWRIAINAAEPVLADTIAAFSARYAPRGFAAAAMTPAWGLAENVTIATAHPVHAAPQIETIDRQALATEGVARSTMGPGLSSVAIGRCLPGCALEIRDREGGALPERHVGTVWLRSDSLFRGYHRDPESGRRVVADGWLDTGDRGYLAGEDLFFVSRDKDLIVIGGEKYAPHDVETAVNTVAGVREGCAVAFGLLDAERGTEDVVVVAETRETTTEAVAALRAAIRGEVMRTTGLGVRQVLLVAPGGIEKTTSGKLARRATRERWAAALAAGDGA
jgi:acyl-CoA synthetase (AMP-forming)/AMP-acid ligase II